MPSHETQAGTLWPTLALTASLCRGRARPRQRNNALQPGVEAAHRPGRRHHCDHSRISPTAPHPRGLNHRGVDRPSHGEHQRHSHGYEIPDGPSRNPAATWCTDARRRSSDRPAGCLQRLPEDGYVVTEREPEAIARTRRIRLTLATRHQLAARGTRPNGR